MQIALRYDPASDATLLGRMFCWLIKARLVSQYCHGGIVINGWLLHITASHGFQKLAPGQWTPDNWFLRDVGGDDAAALAQFDRLSKPPEGRFKRFVWRLLKGYDWFSLLSFVGLLVSVWWLNYCFEWCWIAMTGDVPSGRVTAEMLLASVPDKGAA